MSVPITMFRPSAEFKILTEGNSAGSLYLAVVGSMDFIIVLPTRSIHKRKTVATPKAVTDYIAEQGWTRHNEGRRRKGK